MNTESDQDQYDASESHEDHPESCLFKVEKVPKHLLNYERAAGMAPNHAYVKGSSGCDKLDDKIDSFFPANLLFQTFQVQKRRHYTKTDNEKRQQLISMFKEGKQIKKSAKLLEINYSTAKFIVK